MCNLNQIIANQFNKQSQNFSNWSVTKNIEYMQAYSNFCLIDSSDYLLDVACGTGEFVIFSSPKVKYAEGIDISQGMINLAIRQCEENNITNAKFSCGNVETLPFSDQSFSIVICKSAFHHFNLHERIFNEMIRTCKKGGRIGIQDIIAYPDNNINSYFEELEKEIDISHNSALPKEFIQKLYSNNNLEILNQFELEIELNFREYLGHAYQSEESISRIKNLLEYGINDIEISKYFLQKNDELYFKRTVFCILGKK